ncbi:hypothetical protein [Streptomyces roseolus]|uniref:hypothetical protein n=1 Tax=Streptomyces roseolus TaxID=67358 RepID=UPI00365B239F
MTTPPRRSLGAGPAEADLVRELPGIGFPDLEGLRWRGVLGPPPAAKAPQPRRVLGTRPPEAGQAQ